jgi:hypothetical protein
MIRDRVDSGAFLYEVYSRAVGALPDRLAIKFHFRLRAGYWPDLRNPRTFNEKIQSRKMNGNHAEFARWADKLLAKEFAGRVLGSSFIVPTLWHGPRLPHLPERHWPLPLVIKSNHGTGRNIFLRTAADLANPQLESLCQRWMTSPSHPHLKEHFYELIDRQLLIEPFLGENIPDYKFYVFHGRVHCIHVDTDRFLRHKRNFYDRSWRRLPFSVRYPQDPRDIEPPTHLGEMVEAAELLGVGFDFVRVDFYDMPAGPKFGEMTFTPGGGYERFTPPEWDGILGSYWRLPAN